MGFLWVLRKEDLSQDSEVVKIKKFEEMSGVFRFM